MSIQNGQPLIVATRRETSGNRLFGSFPDCSTEAASIFAALRIGGQCAMTLVGFNRTPNA